MRLPLLLISVAFIGSVYIFITNENELSATKQAQMIPESPVVAYSTEQPITSPSTQLNEPVPMKTRPNIVEEDSVLQKARGEVLMTALTVFWQQCKRQDNCDEMLVQQQLILDERRYQLLLNFPVNQQEEKRLMGESLISQETSLADKIANVKAIREQVWGDDAALLFEQQDAYYDYRLSVSDPESRFNQTQNANDFVNEYNTMLVERGDELDNLSLSSDTAKYEEALKLIPSSMPAHETARIKDELASQYLTANDKQSIAEREQQVDTQAQEISAYQQGLNDLEVDLANERATSKQALSDEEWVTYKAERLYQYRLRFFSS